MTEHSNSSDDETWRIFNQKDIKLWMWDFCQWVCNEGNFETAYYWHDIITNTKLRAYLSDKELLKSYLERDNIYRPFLKRILERFI